MTHGKQCRKHGLAIMNHSGNLILCP